MLTTVLETLVLLVMLRLVRRALAAGVSGTTIGLVVAVLAVGLVAFGWAAAERLPPAPADGGRWPVEGREDGLVFEVECERVLPGRDDPGPVDTADRDSAAAAADTVTVELTVVVPGEGRRVLRLAAPPSPPPGPGADGRCGEARSR